MLHQMKLNEKPFNSIKEATKKIELRLYDEKRSLIKIGDEIIFSKTTTLDEKLKVKVIGLLRFSTFKDLFKYVDYTLSGYSINLEDKLCEIHKIYSFEEEAKNGVLAIVIEKM